VQKDEEVEIYRKKFAGSQADRAASEAAGAAAVVNSGFSSQTLLWIFDLPLRCLDCWPDYYTYLHLPL
jgi:hypothetical protein